MRTIVFMDTHKSGSSREAIQAAERMGYYTVLLTNRSKLLEQREEFPDVHEMISVDLQNEARVKEVVWRLQRYAYVMASGATAELARLQARKAAAQLKFHIHPVK